MSAILTLNAGSSSLKFALFTPSCDEKLRGTVEKIDEVPEVSLQGGRTPPEIAPGAYESVLAALLAWLNTQLDGGAIVAVGHRIVHGGRRFTAPVLITDAVLAELGTLVPLAPLHQPHNLAAISAIARAHPELRQVGCFDTAFHRTLPDVATRLALPAALTDGDLRRTGFHGLSYEYVAGRLREVLPETARVIVAHLGSGASLCALRDGISVETTMGFSTLDGLVMGTRPGGLDPGAILYLLQTRAMTPAALEDLLYHRSGLLGVSGISADMRALAASGAPEARAAIELFVYRLAGEAARLACALGGLDALVFTAGIGEHDAGLRADCCRRLAWLGISLDPAANTAGVGRISAEGSLVSAWVIPTDEEMMIARHTRDVVGPQTWEQGATAAAGG